MEDLHALTERLRQERPAPWEALPDIALYMDQLTAYMPRQLIRFDDSESLTSAMVNNYIKDGLLPRAEGKRYSQTHLAYLTAICALKQVLSVKETKTLIQIGSRGREPERLYAHFRQALDQALTETADGLEEDLGEDLEREGLEREELARLALALALRSYANKLACQRVLSLLQDNDTAKD